MQESPTVEQLVALHGRAVYSADGQMIGDVGGIYYDNVTRVPEWLGVETGFIATRRILVPLRGAQIEGDRVYVAFPKAQVQSAPDVAGEEISEEKERELYAHYGVEPPSLAPPPVAAEESEAAPFEPAPEAADQAITRAEEEVLIGKRQVEAGRIRLRKWVETEPVHLEVELQRETARVVREPIDRPAHDADFGEAEIEVALHAEQPIVHKQAFARERIVVEKDVEVDHELIRDEVRKERVEIEGDNVDFER